MTDDIIIVLRGDYEINDLDKVGGELFVVGIISDTDKDSISTVRAIAVGGGEYPGWGNKRASAYERIGTAEFGSHNGGQVGEDAFRYRVAIDNSWGDGCVVERMKGVGE